MVDLHSRKEPSTPQPGMHSAALLSFSFRLCPVLLIFLFLLVLTCSLVLETCCSRLSPSLLAQGSAPSRARRDRLLTPVGTAVRQGKVLDLLEIRKLKGGHISGRGLQLTQRDAWKICKPRAAGSRAGLNTTRVSMASWNTYGGSTPSHDLAL